MEGFGQYDLKLISSNKDLQAVEELQALIWQGATIVPAHLMIAIAHNGGIIIGAYDKEKLIAFVFSFPGIDIERNRSKQNSHMLGVDPQYRNKGIGFALKRAQWQIARQQGNDLITWTFDPLMSQNAHLNIVKLGAVCETYIRDAYGHLSDGINAGIPTDRFVANWWLNSGRVNKRLGKSARGGISLQDVNSAGAVLLNSTGIDDNSWPTPPENTKELTTVIKERPSFLLVEIPSDFLALKNADLQLASQWRMHCRKIFEDLFSAGYIITDFTFKGGEHPRSFYVLSDGEATLGN